MTYPERPEADFTPPSFQWHTCAGADCANEFRGFNGVKVGDHFYCSENCANEDTLERLRRAGQ